MAPCQIHGACSIHCRVAFPLNGACPDVAKQQKHETMCGTGNSSPMPGGLPLPIYNTERKLLSHYKSSSNFFLFIRKRLFA